MNQKQMFGDAVWLSAGKYTAHFFNNDDPKEAPAFPVLRRKFTIGKVISASLKVVGLGFFHAYINGKEVTEDKFLPLSSDYEPRKDHPIGEKLHGHRLYVPEFDVTDLLKSGENTLAIHFGGGWYTFAGGWFEEGGAHDYNPGERFGDPKVIYRLDVKTENGTESFVSSPSDKIAGSFVRTYQFTNYETQDYTLASDAALDAEFDDSAWKCAEIAKPLKTNYLTTDCPADRIQEIVCPTLLHVFDKKRVYDCGVNLTGIPVLRAKAGVKGKIHIVFSEELTDAGLPHPRFSHRQSFSFVCDGKERTVRPQFTWFGFRYLEIEGDCELVSIEKIHTDVKVTSTFDSDNETLNYIYDAYIRTQLANMHTGIPSDCPTLERRGYTGDGELTCHAAMKTTDSRAFYKKWIADISDCQDDLSGHIQYTAPYTYCGGGPGAWGCAIVEVPWQYYREYGDRSVLAELYPQMLRYFDYMDKHSAGDLVISDQKGVWCLGDWLPPDNVAIPAPFVNTYYYIRSMMRAVRIAKLIGKESDIPALEAKIEAKKTACRNAYFGSWDGNFVGNIQGANAFAVDIGLDDNGKDERTLAYLARYYRRMKKYDTGICGTDVVTRVLFERGFGDVAYGLLTSDDPVSFEGFRRAGYTTLGEYWPHTGADRSHNHPMFGAVAGYLFDYILGIRQPEGCAGYEELIIEPTFIPGLNRVSGSRMIPAGKVEVSYTVTHGDSTRVSEGGDLNIDITLPEGKTGVFRQGGRDYPLHPGKNSIFWIHL